MENLEAVVEDVAANRERVIEGLMQFSDKDFMLFWGENKDLMLKQQKIWKPFLDWASKNMETHFKVTTALDVPEQPKESGYRMRMFLNGLTDKELACFYLVATKLKSFFLASAFIKGAFPLDKILHAAFLEEEYQEEVWGAKEDVRAHFAAVEGELKEIRKFLNERSIY